MEHHAYLLVGSYMWARERLPREARGSGVDTLHIETERYTIDEARALSEQAYRTPVERDVRMFVIRCRDITHEAQNALLKLFEEPPATACFYLILEHDGALLPTLRSRLFLLDVEGEDANQVATAQTFLRLSYAERLEHIARLVKRDDAHERAGALVGGLIAHARVKKTYDTLHHLLDIERMMRKQGASKKMLLEHVALLLPVEK